MCGEKEKHEFRFFSRSSDPKSRSPPLPPFCFCIWYPAPSKAAYRTTSLSGPNSLSPSSFVPFILDSSFAAFSHCLHLLSPVRASLSTDLAIIPPSVPNENFDYASNKRASNFTALISNSPKNNIHNADVEARTNCEGGFHAKSF